MGLLDQILGGMTGNASGQSTMGQTAGGGMGNALVALLPIVLSMLSNRQGSGMGGGSSLGGMGGAGGLGGLLEQMTRSGYGQQAASWVGTGTNDPLPPDAWSDVLGSDRLGAIATQAGLSEEQTRTALSDLLPDVVDRLTPGGQMPATDQLLSSIDDYEQRLRGAETTRG